MVRALHVYKYKKLSDVRFEFEPGLNAISGSNGTCKSSLLHMISNAFQSVSANDERLSTSGAPSVITALNNQVNAKIEKLTKGDKEYNDPAPGFKGSLFEVEYYSGEKLEFRRHNSKVAGRYAVKPYYVKGKGESLPAAPVVYLSLARLLPYGEFQDDASMSKPRKKLDQSYIDDLASMYRDVTGLDASAFAPQKMGAVKNRQEFNTRVDGVDSNTISSGEDNVLIMMTALMTLRYYYESLASDAQDAEVASILLVDEFDATLHPEFQYKLLQIAEDYSAKYHIQVIFTTHSLYLLNQMFAKKMNVIYLMDYVTSAKPMDDPDPVKIEMFLTGRTRSQVLSDKIIPIFSEDEEARLFADILLAELSSRADGFLRLSKNVHFIKANFGAESLMGLFSDVKVRQSSMASICLLDGDHNSDMGNNIVALPGHKSPEWVAFSYALELANGTTNAFWEDDAVQAEGFSKSKFVREGIKAIKTLGCPEKSDRKKVKAYFNAHLAFFRLVLKAWVLDAANAKQVEDFAKELSTLYRKTAWYHGIFISSSDSFDVSVGQ